MSMQRKNHLLEEYLIIIGIKVENLPENSARVRSMVAGHIGKKMEKQIEKNLISKVIKTEIGFITLMTVSKNE